MDSVQFKQVALDYINHGYSIAPLKFKEKIPAIKWEKYQTTRPTEAEVNTWSKMWDDYNIAIITGEVSGITIVDIDGDAGFKSLESLDLPATLSVSTGKGKHLYYRYCDNPAVSNKVGVLPGIDIRNNGGYVVAPPSTHPSGKEYKFNDDVLTLSDFPQAVVDLCTKRNTKATDTKTVTEITEGSRNATLTSMAGSLHHMGLDYDEVLDIVKLRNSKLVSPLDEQEITTLCRSVCRYEQGTRMFPLTDIGVAERFYDRYHDSIRYVSEENTWAIYNGVVWSKDFSDTIIMDKLVTLVRLIPNECKTEEYQESYDKFATCCEGAGKFNSILGLCKTKLATSTTAFDVDPMLLNTQSHTINLSTHQVVEHRSSDMLSKLVPITFDGDAVCPVWLSFLDRIFEHNVPLIDYVQRAVGYSLTGDVSEQVFFTLYGSGANGKSVFLDTLLHLLGNYSQQATFSTFLSKQGDGGVRNDIACMVGARFISAAESGVFKTIDDALIKDITGGKSVKARFLYGEFFEFEPHMKIWLATNHKPNIHDDSKGMWRRVRLIPFNVTIPTDQQDRKLYQRLLDERSGILNWCLAGLKQWQTVGLGTCDTVELATSQYQVSMDTLGRFIEDACIVGSTKECKSSVMYETFSRWCKSNGETVWSNKTFSIKFEDKGYHKVKKKDAAYWLGIDINLDF